MLSVFPAFTNQQTCQRLSRALRAEGLPLMETHIAGATVIRAVRRSGGGLVLCGPRLSDMTAADLSRILGEAALVVVLQRSSRCPENAGEGLVLMEMPLNVRELAEKIRFLLRSEEKRQWALHRNRSAQEEETIRLAKLLLSERHNIDEGDAHRLLQRVSMQEGIRMSLVAQRIIRA